MRQYPPTLQPDSLMAFMRVLCQEIGARPSTSPQEREAAVYVTRILRQAGLSDIQEQKFDSPDSAGWSIIPALTAGLLGSVLGGLERWGKATGGVLLLASAYLFRQRLLVQSPFYRKWIARGGSQNIVAKIPARNLARRTLYLIGHLDSQKQRFQFPAFHPAVTAGQASLPLIFGALGGAGLLLNAARGQTTTPRWLRPLTAAYLWGMAGALNDERQPHVEGANDNATAVAILLGAAQALQKQPLAHTDVVLLFTGCEEVGCVGMEHYLRQTCPSPDNTYWIDLELVGTGNLCYITRHGLTPFTPYAPHPEMVALAERTARERPELGVVGKEMLIIEEVANLRRGGYKAICLAGYDEKGKLPNWHRLSDRLENIEPDTLSRAAFYLWEFMQTIDNEA